MAITLDVGLGTLDIGHWTLDRGPGVAGLFYYFRNSSRDATILPFCSRARDRGELGLWAPDLAGPDRRSEAQRPRSRGHAGHCARWLTWRFQ